MEWELDRKRITLRKQLGIGEFGPIYDAELQLEPNMMSRTLVNVMLPKYLFHFYSFYIIIMTGIPARYFTGSGPFQGRNRGN